MRKPKNLTAFAFRILTDICVLIAVIGLFSGRVSEDCILGWLIMAVLFAVGEVREYVKHD